ncbi:short-chain dehydrogenase/reductase [Chloropicon primus]|uniref:Short-chain dehydrogenase/reductase n=1 Tax=Chloropicon primus TaxID=1764295 RepID=A0A5B8MYX4_9CHLO|nr:short-chain dehydrogenase/reductase [Chloropicon primus]UPR04968.1 short-chain dehydrogenase/reductase [Chloropicon primus]|mmetsp:Transcript_2767/g.7576  ORF Transcript_2767/g.7576 Transcript_2767/m.7576 type:complete len:264 (-) Transcript_2767:140-931(-)|eukprot:QDZ25773.1 short-chain dehydrogenase/reductase [Chloropicon primus]
MATYETLDLKDKVVLITGASAGIGEACAHRMAEAGAKLILIARRVAKLEQIKEDIEKAYEGAKVHIIKFDVKDLDKIGELKAGLPEEFSKVHILVNNAGVALGTPPAHENPIEDVQTMLQTNVSSVMAFVSTFAPGMVERNAGHIVNISSIAGHEAYPGGSVYCATKHAIDAYTTAMRHDLVGTNIRVTAISPGAVRTEFTLVRFGQDAEREDTFYKGFTPLNARDIADNVMYCCTRPSHVQIGDIIIYATKQSSAKSIAKNE